MKKKAHLPTLVENAASIYLVQNVKNIAFSHKEKRIFFDSTLITRRQVLCIEFKIGFLTLSIPELSQYLLSSIQKRGGQFGQIGLLRKVKDFEMPLLPWPLKIVK